MKASISNILNTSGNTAHIGIERVVRGDQTELRISMNATANNGTRVRSESETYALTGTAAEIKEKISQDENISFLDNFLEL